MAALRIQDLATPLIGPVSLEIASGTCTALVGPSGAGKSLLLRAIADLDPNTGSVSLGDRVREAIPARDWRRLISLVPAESGWWTDRVADHFPVPETAAPYLAALDLAEALGWDVARLSTGERQRLALARALTLDPGALMLDEPTAALHEEATAMVEALIRARIGAGAAVLLVTHDPAQARRLADRVVTMRAGRIEAAEAPA